MKEDVYKLKFKKVLPVLALIGALAYTPTAFAATGGVTGSTLDFASDPSQVPTSAGTNVSSATSAVDFGTVGTINVASTLAAKNGLDHIRIDDNRGTGTGWNVKVSASDLTTTVNDTTGAKTGQVTATVPINAVLQYQAASPAAINNSVLTNVNATTSLTSMTGTAASVMSAASGYGAGAYSSDLTYTLTLPNYFPSGTTLNSTDGTSVFKTATATDVGLFAGTYTTTVTYAITDTP